MAEGVGFEPTEACTSHAFEACPFGRSGTLPGGTLPVPFSGPSENSQDMVRTCRKPGVQVDLFNGEPPAPRPAWRVIEAARNQHLTGELALPSNPPTNVYLINGEVYFAERTTDGGIGVRLLINLMENWK